MKLTWVGARFGDGRPMEHLAYYGIPARDIDDGELTPEQERQALDSGLYEQADRQFVVKDHEALKAVARGEIKAADIVVKE